MGSVLCWIWKCVFLGNLGRLVGICGEVIGVVGFDGLYIFVSTRVIILNVGDKKTLRLTSIALWSYKSNQRNALAL